MKLRKVKGKNRWCGPCAIAAVTGKTSDDADLLLRKAGATVRHGQVQGTWDWEMRRAFWLAGIRMEFRNDMRKPVTFCWRSGSINRWGEETQDHKVMRGETFGQWCERTEDERLDSGLVYLVAAGEHWQLVQKNRYVCSKTMAVVNVWHPKVSRRSVVTGVYDLKPL